MDTNDVNARLAEYEAMIEKLKKEDPERYLQFLEELLPQLQEMEDILRSESEDEGIA